MIIFYTMHSESPNIRKISVVCFILVLLASERAVVASAC